MLVGLKFPISHSSNIFTQFCFANRCLKANLKMIIAKNMDLSDPTVEKHTGFKLNDTLNRVYCYHGFMFTK